MALRYVTPESRAAFSGFCGRPLLHQRLLFLFNMQFIPPSTFRANMETGILAASPESDLLLHILADTLVHNADYLHLAPDMPNFAANTTLTAALYPQMVLPDER